MDQRPDPRHLSISKSKGILIEWKDGSRSDLSLRLLRDRCPCATCTGAHGTPPREPDSPFRMYQPALKIDRVETVGNYAIQICWNDGHNTGIYTWEYLRQLTQP